jgi:hypothetical protein
MRTVTEARNAVDHEFKSLSRLQSAFVYAAWAAIEEWAASKGLKV